MKTAYRTNAKPEEQPRKRPLLCRIGFHFWGGWALEGDYIFFCTRCDRYFLSNTQKQPLTSGFIFSRRIVGVGGRRCDGLAIYKCHQQATHVVLDNDWAYLLCIRCAEQAAWYEGPDVKADLISRITT